MGSYSGVVWESLWGAFGSLLGSFLEPLGTTWAPFGGPLACLWVLWVFVGCLFPHFSVLLGASGHSGVPLCPFVSP